MVKKTITKMKSIKILLADDHQLVRDGLKKVLELVKGFKVVAQAANGEEALEKAAQYAPDVALLDISMPVLNGIDTVKIMRENFPDVKTIMLSMHSDAVHINSCIDNGADGYLVKSEGSQEMIKAITTVMEGKQFFSAEATKAILESALKLRSQSAKQPTGVDALTDREKEVLKHIAKGASNHEIADVLFISFRTVETHRANLMRKLHARNSVELVNKARQRALLD
jgi:DNA-binding NarL/FixJ family response regulator